jgi:hypothetical protein
VVCSCLDAGGEAHVAAHELDPVIIDPPVNVSQARERPQEIVRHRRELDSPFFGQLPVLVNNLSHPLTARPSGGGPARQDHDSQDDRPQQAGSPEEHRDEDRAEDADHEPHDVVRRRDQHLAGR